MNHSISVIIPVYNGEFYIKKAILSAVNQKEVTEVIIINDGSTDKTDIILKDLQSKYSVLKLFYHKNKINKGRSASRNLGLKNATSNYIAFLDADDFYLKDRFKNDINILKKDETVDGVYNAIGVHFYRDFTKEEYEERRITTVNEVIKSEYLFRALIYYTNGHFSLDGYILKKSILNLVGDFDENLKVGEDTAFILKTTLKGKIVSGILESPVAVRGIHNSNVFNDKDVYNMYRLKLYESLLFWSYNTKINFKYIDYILDNLWRIKFEEKESLLKNTLYWKFIFFKKPKILFSKLGLKYFPLIRMRQKYFF